MSRFHTFECTNFNGLKLWPAKPVIVNLDHVRVVISTVPTGCILNLTDGIEMDVTGSIEEVEAIIAAKVSDVDAVWPSFEESPLGAGWQRLDQQPADNP